MATILCQTCGYAWDDEQEVVGYHFSSASNPKGSYVGPKAIADAGEDVETCPRDPGRGDPTDRGYLTGATPSGGSMYEGDNRYTAGDETHPSKYEL